MAGYQVGYVARNPKTGMQTTLQADGSWSNPEPMTTGAALPPSVISSNAAQVKAVNDEAQLASGLANQSQHAMELNKQTGSGGILGMPIIGGPIRTIAEQFDPPLKAMDSASVNMAKSMRAQGQRLTQMEWARNLGAVPSPSNTPAGNAAINTTFQNANTLAQAKAAFTDSYAKSHNYDISGLVPAWNQWKSQHFDDSMNYHPGGVPVAGGAQPAPTATAPGGWAVLGEEK